VHNGAAGLQAVASSRFAIPNHPCNGVRFRGSWWPELILALWPPASDDQPLKLLSRFTWLTMSLKALASSPIHARLDLNSGIHVAAGDARTARPPRAGAPAW